MTTQTEITTLLAVRVWQSPVTGGYFAEDSEGRLYALSARQYLKALENLSPEGKYCISFGSL